jgi:hypothetical protein
MVVKRPNPFAAPAQIDEPESASSTSNSSPDVAMTSDGDATDAPLVVDVVAADATAPRAAPSTSTPEPAAVAPVVDAADADNADADATNETTATNSSDTVAMDIDAHVDGKLLPPWLPLTRHPLTLPRTCHQTCLNFCAFSRTRAALRVRIVS